MQLRHKESKKVYIGPSLLFFPPFSFKGLRPVVLIGRFHTLSLCVSIIYTNFHSSTESACYREIDTLGKSKRDGLVQEHNLLNMNPLVKIYLKDMGFEEMVI